MHGSKDTNDYSQGVNFLKRHFAHESCIQLNGIPDFLEAVAYGSANEVGYLLPVLVCPIVYPNCLPQTQYPNYCTQVPH